MDVQINELQASERSYADKEDLKVQGENRDQVGLLINCNDSIFYPFLFFPDICFYYAKFPNCSSGCLFFVWLTTHWTLKDYIKTIIRH